MNYLIFICMATGSVLADLSAPTQALPTIMAALRDQRDDGSVTTAAPSAEESLATHPFAYYSFGGEGDGTSTWVPILYPRETYTVTSSGSFWRICSLTESIIAGSVTSVSILTYCPLWTTCSMGYLVAASASYFCETEGNACNTALLYSTLGEENPISSLFCDAYPSDLTAAPHYMSYYITRPPGIELVTETDPDITPTAPPQSPTPTPSRSMNPALEHTKSKSASIIAGSVVGAIVVICLTAVAVFCILRRGKNKTKKYTASPALGRTQESRTELHQVTGFSHRTSRVDIQEYDPDTSGYSTSYWSPLTHGPGPPYELGSGQSPSEK